MPIRPAKALNQPTENEFKRLAHDVVGQAFDLHNQYGNLFAENIYKHELAARCAKLGYQGIETEFPIELTHKSFRKRLYIDLLIEGAAPFELKVQPDIVDSHRAQTLNYLFLTELQRSKLINFGAAALEHEFVSTTLLPEDRYHIRTHDEAWKPLGAQCEFLRSSMMELLDDWGGWLTLHLYQEAIVHQLGGEDVVFGDVAVESSDDKTLAQKAHRLSEGVVFKLTCLPGGTDGFRRHMLRWLKRTALDGIQWINLHRRDVSFVTLSKPC